MVQQFIESILDGRIKQGERLASEVQLAAEFQISRNILREAMKTLEVLGIVEIYHGRGTFVSEYAKARIANVDFVRALAKNQTVIELLETRLVIGPGLAEFAAQGRTPDDIEQMWASIGNMVQDYSDEERNGWIFHRIVARASRFDVLTQYLDSIYKRLQYSNYGILASTFSERHLQNEIKDHQKILECIIDRDGKSAKNLMYVHIANRYNMIQSFQSKG